MKRFCRAFSVLLSIMPLIVASAETLTPKDKMITFVQEFIDAVNCESNFSVLQENYFFGFAGGIPGMTLYHQLNCFDSQNMKIIKKVSCSPLGILLQKKRNKIFRDSDCFAALFYELKPLFIMQEKKRKKIDLSLTYIMIMWIKRKDIMSVDNDIHQCILAIDRHSEKPRIDLLHSSVNGQRLLGLLGFIPSENFTNMELKQHILNSIKQSCLSAR